MKSENELNRLSSPRLRVRQVDELIGLAKGVTADGVLADSELDFLVRWLVTNKEITDDPIVAALYHQIQSMLSDGVFTLEERSDLFGILQDFGSHPMEMGEPMLSTAIPFARPLPELTFGGSRYRFTGTFTFGTRDACEAAATERGQQPGH